MTHSDTVAAIHAWASERRLPERHLERWLKMSEADRAALLSIAQTLRLSTGTMMSALAMLEEISLRESRSVESILVHDEIARTTKGAGSTPARAKAFLDALRSIRYPRLAEAATRLKARIAALGLPRGISVLLPKNLSSDELKVELRAKDGAELKRLIGALGANAEKFAEIVDLLGGEREV